MLYNSRRFWVLIGSISVLAVAMIALTVALTVSIVMDDNGNGNGNDDVATTETETDDPEDRVVDSYQWDVMEDVWYTFTYDERESYCYAYNRDPAWTLEQMEKNITTDVWSSEVARDFHDEKCARFD